MFTGIVQSTGSVTAVEKKGGDARLTIDAGTIDLSGSGLGDSIAVNGVCLTAIDLGSGGFSADVSTETLSVSTIGTLEVSSVVNLEPALTLSQPLGGHLVSGHVDGIGQLHSLHSDARSTRMEFTIPDGLARYIAVKGSVCIDGISLTVNEVFDDKFCVNIVPHTLEQTIMRHYREGIRVNLEVDLIARYLERLMSQQD